jgi:hypothetical protein
MGRKKANKNSMICLMKESPTSSLPVAIKESWATKTQKGTTSFIRGKYSTLSTWLLSNSNTDSGQF